MDDQALKEKEWDNLLKLFLHTKNKEELNSLFQLFVTSHEKDMLVDRYRLVKELLSSNSSQRDIAQQLGLSISKITQGSKAVQALSEKDRKLLVKKLKRV